MIEVEHLSKTYGSTAAIADVSFSVESGEILGFLGPNGAGKTTTMRILSGYLPASSGTARIAGLDVHENSMAVRQRIGYLPENPPLYPEMSVEGFLFFVARIKQVPAGDRARRVTSAIERCGLIEKRKVLIRKLSKGFKQRVGIAQAIVHDPPVIILDEPTVGLDPRQIIEVRNLIKSLGDQHTIILSTHILPEVSMTCNRVTIINRGQIVAAGTPEHLMGELATGEGYEVEVEGEADLLNSLLLPSLENVPGVRSVELIPSQQFLTSRYRLRALCESDIEPGRDIATAIIASGFGLCEMRRNRASLEDVFLRLTVAQQKPEESLVHSEPEVDRNLQAVAEIQDALADAHQSESQPTIADAHQSESPPIVENLLVSDRQQSLYDSDSASEPIAETVESLYDSDSASEPVVETVGSIEHHEPASEPFVETVELIEHHEPEFQSVVETVESIEYHEPESQSVVETVESIGDIEPEMQPVAEFLLLVERQGSIEHHEPEMQPVAEIVESIEHREPEMQPVVEIVESIEHREPEMQPVAEIVESIEHREPEMQPVAEIVESIEYHEPEMQPVAEIVESIEHREPEMQPVAEILESIEHREPEPIVENLLVVETVESIEYLGPESEPAAQIIESIEHREPESEPVAETVESIEHREPESEPVAETVESIEHREPEPIVENLLVVETVESIE
ncbi:ATP-binding cassette domain-containing protein, partial [Microcoleus sp. Aus8_D4]|uniref:ABC transporter ATP-binding protein n=1 Tax=Microcoleus sp. Aus8_D4 TaxID=2818634 RepID=UPI003FA54382